MHDPFLRAGWYGWGIVVVLLIGVVFACTVSGAQEQNPALAPEKVYCMNGMCIVRQDTLLLLLNGIKTMSENLTELREGCGK